MACRYLLISAFIILGSVVSNASIYGILTGKVTDQDGKPVGGASVRVIGTTRGAFANMQGKYTILNVTAGEYDVRATAVGYDTLTLRVSLLADETRTLNFALTQGGVLKERVEILADREMVRTTDIGTSRAIKGKDVEKIARDNIASVLSLAPGVQASGNNFIIRGSRPDETQVLVDGLVVTDQFTGGLGNVGSTISAAMPSPYATEEVQANTGAFGAEYGNAVGGTVNTVVKTGRTDMFEGLLRWRIDVPFLWGNAGNGVVAGTPGEDVVDATLGGPLGLNRSTFFISVRNTYHNYRNYGLQVLDPWGNNLGQQPNNRTWSRNITGRLKFQLSNDMTLLLGGQYGLLAGERASQSWLYATGTDVKVDASGIPILDGNGNIQSTGFVERDAKQIVVQDISMNAFAQINQVIGSTMAYEVRAAYTAKISETGRRKAFEPPSWFSGWELWYPEDKYSQVDSLFLPSGPDRQLDVYQLVRSRGVSEDGYLEMEISRRNPLTGFVEGSADYQNTRNPYGLFSYFANMGNEGGVDFRRSSFWQIDGNVTYNLETGDAKHVLKAGAEMRFQTLSRHSNSNPWDGNPWYDVYGSYYGGNLYSESSPDIKALTEEPFTPVTGGLFVQDQIIFKNLVFTPGVRFDYLDPDALYRPVSDQFIPIDSIGMMKKASAKFYISPRLTITYPVSESGRQNFRLAYGIYYMQTPFQSFYDSYNTTTLRTGSLLGNPNNEMQRTNQYEVSYNHQITDNFAFSITGYYKDIYNQTDIAYVDILPTPYYQSVMSAYGSSKGIEITFQRRTADNWGFNLNYTLASAIGTSNNATTLVALDPYTQLAAFPVDPFPLGFDRRHRVNGVFTLDWGPDQGPTIAGYPFLEYLTINISGYWQTGTPYTPVNGQGQAVGAINSSRFPSTWNSELRINRTIPLANLIGGNTAIDVFLDVTNLFNFTDAVSYYTRTGSPDYDGLALNRVPGDFPSTTYYKDADPRDKATTHPSQYDRVGRRLYNATIDSNHDNTVTASETYAGYQQYVADVVARRNNYQYPRQVYFGVMFRF